MIYPLVATLLVVWILGFGIFHVGGGLIHTLLVVACIAIIWRVVGGRRAVG